MDLPGPELLGQLGERLEGNDVGWFREKYKSGDLKFLEGRLPQGEYSEMGRKLDADDLGWVKQRLGDGAGEGGLLKGLGGIAGTGAAGLGAAAAGLGGAAKGAAAATSDAAKGAAGMAGDAAKGTAAAGAAGLGAAAGVAKGAAGMAGDAAKGTAAAGAAGLGAAAGVAKGAAGMAGDAAKGAAGAIGGAAKGAAGMAGGAAKGLGGAAGGAMGAIGGIGAGGSGDGRKKRPAWLWIVPLAIVAGLIVLALTQCGNDDDDDAPVTTDTVAEATIAGAPDTVAAAPVETVAVTPETVAATPDSVAATPDTAAAILAAAPTGDIVSTAVAAGNFTTLATAIEAAGLGETLKGAGPLTVFAPTDEAFAKLPAGTVEALVANKDALTKILNYHVVPGALKAADLFAGPLASTSGERLTVAVDGTTVKVNDATVIAADNAATNGVIHGIDTVLLPPGLDLASLAAPATTIAETAATVDSSTTNVAGDATPEGLTVYFASGSAALDAEAQAKITGAVETLRALAAGSTVDIVGHADNKGNAAANQRLSESRAGNVEAALKAGLGADSGKITFASSAKGDSEQAADLAKSRRVTIEIK